MKNEWNLRNGFLFHAVFQKGKNVLHGKIYQHVSTNPNKRKNEIIFLFADQKQQKYEIVVGKISVNWTSCLSLGLSKDQQKDVLLLLVANDLVIRAALIIRFLKVWSKMIISILMMMRIPVQF